MSQIIDYFRPRNLDEALDLLAEGGGRTAVLAGGTSLSVRPPASVTGLVDICDLGLDYITERNGKVLIGACTRISSLLESELLTKVYGGMIPEAASTLGSTPLRNLITVGGNAFHVMPWSDLPGVFLATGAVFRVLGAGRTERYFPATEFYNRHPRQLLSPGEMLVEVQIPIPDLAHFGAFHKVTRTVVDYAALSVAVGLVMKQDIIVEARIALGSARTLPARVRQAEAELVNQSPSRALFVKAAAITAGVVEPLKDFRCSADYKKHVAKIWTRRCLEKAARMSLGGSYAD